MSTKNKKHPTRPVHCGIFAATIALLDACTAHPASVGESATPSQTQEQVVAFAAASVDPSQTVSRADGSLVNRKEYHLRSTATTGEKVGIFGAYTGQQTWAEYKTSNSKEPPADFMFNVPATIGSSADIKTKAGNANALTYSPLRFWPNTTVEGSLPSHLENVSFWAYYPYNPTGDPGEKGIAIVPTASSPYGLQNGMGKIKFTMQTDAADQTDFLLSDLVANANKNTYPLAGEGDPEEVPFTFHHMLAQVRVYTFLRLTDKLVYQVDGEDNPVYYDVNDTYKDEWGKEHTVTVANTVQKIDETKSMRWKRTSQLDKDGEKYRADHSLSLSFNNIYTSAIFTPSYDGANTKFPSAVQGMPTGSATVTDYVENPYWFTFDGDNNRVMLNEDFMYDYFEDAPSSSGGDTNALGYALSAANKLPEADKHYNYAPGNILLVVPQTLTDEDVPHIVLTANGTRKIWNSGTSSWEDGSAITAKVTVNLLNLNIQWESGYIYCYAFIDELHPGDDIVRGPETITVVFDPSQHTDQW
ncbi:MAG: fimbrillin family protein [Prevotella sp.]|nr:fimbrillin family protein [Prevotella sp.]